MKQNAVKIIYYLIILKLVGCKAIVLASHHKKSNYIQFLNDLAPEIKTSKFGSLKSKRLPTLKYLVRIDDEPTPGMINYKDVITMGGSKDFSNLHRIMNITSPDDATNIQFTSGTTGHPKGATLTHFNLINDSFFVGQRVGYTEKDSICLPVPLYHCFGMVLGNLTAINFGSTIVLPGEGFVPKQVMEAVTKYKCTSIYGVPTMFLEYIKEYEANPSIYDHSSLTKGVMAGALCPEVINIELETQYPLS